MAFTNQFELFAAFLKYGQIQFLILRISDIS